MCRACEILRLNQESAAFLLFGEFFCFFQYLILGGDSMPVRVVDRIICCNFCCCSCCHNHEPPTLWAKHSLIKGLREFLAKFVRASTVYLTRVLVHRFKKETPFKFLSSYELSFYHVFDIWYLNSWAIFYVNSLPSNQTVQVDTIGQQRTRHCILLHVRSR